MQFKGTIQEVCEQIQAFARDKGTTSITVQVVWWDPLFPPPKPMPYHAEKKPEFRIEFSEPEPKYSIRCKYCTDGFMPDGSKCIDCGGTGFRR